MKLIKRTGLALLFLPVILILIFILYEFIGMCVNHSATRQQTMKLRTNLENAILDITIVDVYSETGNTSGTGNHVDCLSAVTFSTKMQESEIKNSMSEYYEFDEWSCYIDKTDDGNYLFYLNVPAPFENNIEGH